MRKKILVSSSERNWGEYKIPMGRGGGVNSAGVSPYFFCLPCPPRPQPMGILYSCQPLRLENCKLVKFIWNNVDVQCIRHQIKYVCRYVTMCFYPMMFHMDFNTGLFRRPTKRWSTHQLNSIYTVASLGFIYISSMIVTKFKFEEQWL